MPDKREPVEEDVRARFGGANAEAPVDRGELPEVPRLGIERPRPKAYHADTPRRFMNGGMFAGGDMRSSGAALTIGTGLVASIVVGAGLGWLADKYLLHSTNTPWGLIVGFLLGVTSGFINLVRVANQINQD